MNDGSSRERAAFSRFAPESGLKSDVAPCPPMGGTAAFPTGISANTTPQHPQKQPMTTTPLASIGIDVGKDVFHFVVEHGDRLG